MNLRTKLMTRFIAIILTSLLYSTTLLAGNYTWNGGTSTAWGTSTNWTPNGTPSTNDTVTIVTGSNNVYIAAKTEVKLLTMTSGTLNLQTNELSVGANSFFNGGTVTNGLLTLIGTNHTFAGSTISTKVSARCTRVFLNGSVFNDSLKIVIPSTGRVHASKGGNTFNGPVSITDSAIAGITLADSLPDIFNSTLDLYNASTANIFIAHKATGCQFNGIVSFNGPNIYSNYYGSATYTSNIILNNASGNFFFGYSTGSCTLTAGNKISIGGSGMSSGQLYLRNFTSLDSTAKITLNMTGTAKLYFESGSVFYDTISASVPTLYLNGSKFHGVTILESNGSSNVTSTGGCSFYKKMSFENKLSTSAIYSFANAQTDTFLMSSSFINKGGTFTFNKGLFYGKCSIDNKAASVGEGFYIASTGTCTFKDSLYFIEINTPGIRFGNSGGITVLDSNSTFVTETGTGGNVFMQNVTKLSSSSLTMEESPSELTLTSGNSFNGNFYFHGNSVISAGTTFNSAATLKLHATSNVTFGGGNTFNGTTIIQDSSLTAHNTFLANSTADDYNADVTFIQKGTSVNLYPAYTKNSTFSGNIAIDGTSSMQFGRNGGKVVVDGTSAQSINRGTTSLYPTIKKLLVNKASNSLTLNSPLTVSDSLQLTNGRINTDTTNLLSISHGGKLVGGSDSTYINGPLKKTGNATFTFAVGSSSLAHPYHPIEITAPTSSTDAYTAHYFPTGQTIGTAIDSTIDNLNACQYWNLTRNSGTSKVKVKLSWNNDSCETISPTNFRVTGWNGSIWEDLGNAATSGDSIVGTVQSGDSLNSISSLTLAFLKCSAFRKILTKNDVKCNGGSDGVAIVNGLGATAGYKYQWSEGMGINQNVNNLRAGKYYFQIEDSRGCLLSDSIIISEPDSIQIETSLIKPDCGDSTGVIILNITGGVGAKTNTWMEFDISGDTLTGLSRGEYLYSIVDSIQCRVNGTITLDNENSPNVVVVSSISPVCFKDASGMIEVEGDNGVPPYTFRWLNYHNDSSAILNLIKAGVYIVEVIDSLNCMGLDTVELAQADTFELTLSIVNTPCNSSTGQITPIITGGNRPFNYAWTPANSTDSILNNMPSGIQELIITDSSGCIVKGRAEIMSSSGISISSTVINDAVCIPDSGGIAFVSASGGTMPFTYEWWPNGGNNDTAYNLPPDNYTVTVVDSNGCRQSTTLEITGPNILEAILSTALPTSDSTNDGSVFATCLGGVPPYQYLWSTGGTNDSIENIGIGIYNFEVSDSRGCKSKSEIEISQVRICHNCYPFTEVVSECVPTHPTICSTCMDPVYLNIEDFGADGSDSQSDQCAFEEVSHYINSLHPDVSKVLTIPPGTYFVGRQVEGLGGYYLAGVGVLCFQNINNLQINPGRPTGITELRFMNCMKYGAFDIPSNPDNRFLSDIGRSITCTLTAGNPVITYSGSAIDPAYTYTVWDPDVSHNTPGTKYIVTGTISSITTSTFTITPAPANFTGTIIYQLGIISDCRIENNYSQLAHCGNMIQLNYCKNISINNLELNGNLENAIIGGGGSADGLQHAYDGIFINASNDIVIRNVDEHHFGHDGLWLKYVDCEFPPVASLDDMDCTVINSKFQYNGRNALSWTGGRSLTCFNSEFSFTGQSRIISQPGAGMDIEFEPHANTPISYAQGNSNGVFRNCNFRYNKYHGFISDGGRGTRFTSNNYDFFNCTFVSGESTDCIWPNVAGCYFSDCSFYGLAVQPFQNTQRWTNFSPDNDCIFDNCFFGEIYNDQDPFTPLECYGAHSFSTSHSETVFSAGSWIPDPSVCPTHRPQIDFSNAKRVTILSGSSLQGFSNKVMLLGTELVNVPPADWNTIDGTIFTSSGMNFCGCEDDQTLFDFTNIGPGNIFFRSITPFRFTTLPPCNPYSFPYAYAEPHTAQGGQFGVLFQGTYNTLTNPPMFQEDLVPKFLNLNVPNSAMPLYQSPCLLTPAFVPSVCTSPLRVRQYSNDRQIPSLKIIPNISTDKIRIETNQENEVCQIISSLGEIVYGEIYVNYSKEIEISNLKSGLFLVRSNSGEIVKFIKY